MTQPAFYYKFERLNLSDIFWSENANKFVKTKDLIDIANKNDLELIKIDGVSFNILKNRWLISNDNSVNYISQFKKF